MQRSGRMFTDSDPGARMVRSAGSKIFQDAVHGPMEFHELLVAIIDTPEFQRMRNIKQLSLTYFVYPAAAHNRFEHSLGVCFLAGQLLKAIEDNTDERTQKETFLKNGQESWKKHKLCVLIAGLCHDLGHGPFSHTWEAFVGKANFMHGIEEKFEHEKASGEILDAISQNDIHGMFKKHKIGKDEIKIIKELISGEAQSLEESMNFLCEIVANKKNDIDVDKWDYFLRDGLSLHLKITFDYRRLIKFCKVVKHPNSYTSLAFRDKEFISLRDMFRMRADLHLRAYQHRVSKNVELMFIDAMLKADQMLHLSEAHRNMDTYTKLTDHILQEVMYKSDVADANLQAAQHTLKRIMKRHLYQQIDEHRCIKKLKLKDVFLLEKNVNMGKHDKNKDHFGVVQIHLSNGAHGQPLSLVSFYDKEGELVTDPATDRYPETGSGLPFGILLLFCKLEKCEMDHISAKQHFKQLAAGLQEI